jgi:hypothetical protein
MNAEDIEVSEKGVKLSYGRFLADSASGYVLILTIVYLVFRSTNVKTLASEIGDLKSSLIVVTGVLLLLLGPPFGLALNGFTWFLLGWIQVRFINRWEKTRWAANPFVKGATYGTRRVYNLACLEQSFLFLSRTTGPCGERLYSEARIIERTMRMYHPHEIQRVEYLNGVKIFSRNISFLAIAVTGMLLYERSYILGCLGLLTVLVLTLLACLLELYRLLEILFCAYIICLQKQIQSVPSGMKLQALDGAHEPALILVPALALRQVIAELMPVQQSAEAK